MMRCKIILIVFFSLYFQNGLTRLPQSNHGHQDETRSEEDGTFKKYHTFDQILDFLWHKAERCGSRCSLIDIGYSYERRPLRLIKITNGDNRKKPGIIIDAGIHAREWIAHVTAMFIINMLTCHSNCDSMVAAMLRDYDWYILPVLNPDGYVYTWTTDRNWRKSRQPGVPGGCIGVDMNRNFDHMWAQVANQPDPCSEVYAGEAPLSEPETRALSQFIMWNQGNWNLYLTLHAKGQLILAPWGYSTNLTTDYMLLKKAGDAAVNAIKETHGEDYVFGSAANVLYQSSGTSRDWAKGVAEIPYVYTMELRPETNDSFWHLDEKYIIPVGEEIWAAVKAMVQNILPI